MIKVYRLLITLFIIVISLSKASAQIGALFKNIDEAEILAGTSLVTLRGVDFREYKTVKFGYSAGISASWQLMKKAGVSVGILYERKGMNYFFDKVYYYVNEQEFIGESKNTINFNYLSAPMTFYYLLGKKEQFLVNIGFYFAYLHRAQSIVKNSWEPERVVNIKDSYREFDGGLYLNLGYKIPFNNKLSLKIWTAASYGLVDVSLAPSFSSLEISKNESLAIGVSLLKKK